MNTMSFAIQCPVVESEEWSPPLNNMSNCVSTIQYKLITVKDTSLTNNATHGMRHTAKIHNDQ
jgi:hypothetical protein